MLLINRLNITIITETDNFYFDESFQKGVNIIASDINTSGKSSVISAILYCLGMEEIIGGKGSKVLSAAFNKKIKSIDNTVINVLKSKIFLEISNGDEIVTIFRSVQDPIRHDNLISVMFGKYEDRNNAETKEIDMFVHNTNSAKGVYGFFTFLEKFIGIKLPNVLGYDGKEKKLYIQNVFSGIIIEQKRGWSDILSRVPNFGIKDPKRKTVEFLLNMDSLELSKLKLKTNNKIKAKIDVWKELYTESNTYFKSIGLRITGITKEIDYIEDDQIDILDIETSLNLKNVLIQSNIQLKEITDNKYIKINNNAKLNEELLEIIKVIDNLQIEVENLVSQKNKEFLETKTLQNGLKNLNNDIQNNKDVQRIIEFGSGKNIDLYKGVCPTCNQRIDDTLITSQKSVRIMTPNENIKHLESQRILFESIIKQKEEVIKDIDIRLINKTTQLKRLEKLAVSIKQDLFKLNDEYNEHVIVQRLSLERRIEELINAQKSLLNYNKKFIKLSQEYKILTGQILVMDKNDFSKEDVKKINSLRNRFIENLKDFGYRSINPDENISISYLTLLPEIMGYDLKFDSSASDHIRGIWAYTIALQQVSLEYKANHPNLLIFDEPNQHSIIEEDMNAFLTKVDTLKNNEVQTIIGFTMKDDYSKKIIEDLDVTSNIIKIEELAFKKIE